MGLLALVSLALAGFVVAGVSVPGVGLAREIGTRILCAAALADHCGDEPVLIAAYGSEVGEMVRQHMPWLLFEEGSRAVPVDFRRCRETSCGDGVDGKLVKRTEAGLPVAAFVHVIDCRPDAVDGTEGDGINCSDSHAGNLYIQYWTYYADSATFRGVPVAEDAGYHPDDWEGVQVRIRSDGSVQERATSHEGYDDRPGPIYGWASDAGIDPVKDTEEAIGLRDENGWGPETHLLMVSGGSHAGHTDGIPKLVRLTPGSLVHLIPLEPIATTTSARFAISPPWRKRVWRDPEAEGTN